MRCVDIVVPPVLLEGTSPWRRRRRERERRTKVSGWANFWLWLLLGQKERRRQDRRRPPNGAREREEGGEQNLISLPLLLLWPRDRASHARLCREISLGLHGPVIKRQFAFPTPTPSLLWTHLSRSGIMPRPWRWALPGGPPGGTGVESCLLVLAGVMTPLGHYFLSRCV